MAVASPEPAEPGIWPDAWLLKAVESGLIDAPHFAEEQLQPASVDLTLGTVAHRLRCSFLPGKNDTIEKVMRSFVIGPPIPLEDGAILERNRPYLIPLRERLALPKRVRARANPKSSTGRLDVFTRVITDRNGVFDDVKGGYHGPLYLEVVPRSFAVMAKTGIALNQLRLVKGDASEIDVPDTEIRAAHRTDPILYRNGQAVDRRDVYTQGGLWLTLDLLKRDDEPVGYRAKHNSSLVDLTQVDAHDPEEFWETVVPETGNRVVLEPEDFYLLLSAEAIRVPPEYAAEMTAFDPAGGEVRTHYAGFFDPGFGHDPSGLFSQGSRAALEIRAHDVPFAVDHLQRVCSLRFERMAGTPTSLYGSQRGSHYQGQMSTLSKHFRLANRADQATFNKSARPRRRG
ncbi:MAG TPA: 2'-deoxycytidine 5'-triphosphate deaminase [Acidimicrobiia bacterium]|nr:2'-deoxycytidine 5'-triphosphate deaminase [Acidimicrobiia bacterium]